MPLEMTEARHQSSRSGVAMPAAPRTKNLLCPKAGSALAIQVVSLRRVSILSALGSLDVLRARIARTAHLVRQWPYLTGSRVIPTDDRHATPRPSQSHYTGAAPAPRTPDIAARLRGVTGLLAWVFSCVFRCDSRVLAAPV